MLSWMLTAVEGADPDRAATLALLHDSQESRITDLGHVGRGYLDAAANERITADQTAALPRLLVELLRGLVAEYEGRTSLEADCARDADKLEMLL
jgi:putative hydrolase of HD superfamily